jgi:hypothetical protein
MLKERIKQSPYFKQVYNKLSVVENVCCIVQRSYQNLDPVFGLGDSINA